MKINIVEISGYISAICAMYMTNRNLTAERKGHIIDVVEKATNRYGFIKPDESEEKKEFLNYMEKTITYGIKHEHHQILKFIDVHIHMEGLHRAAQDDYDAHAKRLEIIRSTTRTTKGANYAEFSDFYKSKVMSFDEMHDHLNGFTMGEEVTLSNGTQWIKKPWGYVLAEYANNPDVIRGLTPLGMSSENISKVPYGEHLQHIYNLRRENPKGKNANPELQQAMEMLRDDLSVKCPPLGYYLGKVWVESDGGHYAEKNRVYMVSKDDEEV